MKESSVCVFSQSLPVRLAKKRYSRDADRLLGSYVSDSPPFYCHIVRRYISVLGDILIVEISLEHQQSFIMVSGTAPYADCTVIHALIQDFNLMTTGFGKPPLQDICWTHTHRTYSPMAWPPQGEDWEEGSV